MKQLNRLSAIASVDQVLQALDDDGAIVGRRFGMEERDQQIERDDGVDLDAVLDVIA